MRYLRGCEFFVFPSSFSDFTWKKNSLSDWFCRAAPQSPIPSFSDLSRGTPIPSRRLGQSPSSPATRSTGRRPSFDLIWHGVVVPHPSPQPGVVPNSPSVFSSEPTPRPSRSYPITQRSKIFLWIWKNLLIRCILYCEFGTTFYTLNLKTTSSNETARLVLASYSFQLGAEVLACSLGSFFPTIWLWAGPSLLEIGSETKPFSLDSILLL